MSYNPYLTKSVDEKIESVVAHLQDGTYSVSPFFQRNYVWDNKKRNSLIESLLLGYALPTFFAYTEEDSEGKLFTYFSDGQQRLTTLKDFKEDKFRFKTEIHELIHLNGKKFSEFDARDKNIINEYLIKIEKWMPDTPLEIIMDHYNRINTCGAPLNKNAIRRSQMFSPYYVFLQELSNKEDFLELLGNRASQKNIINLDNEKYCHIWAALFNNRIFNKGESKYKGNPANRGGLLDENLKHFHDNPKDFTDELKIDTETKFNNALKNIKCIFGDRSKYAFRRILKEKIKGKFVIEEIDSYEFGPFNQVIFETMMYLFSFADHNTVKQNKENIMNSYYNEIIDNESFFLSLARGTTGFRTSTDRYKIFYKLLCGAGVVFNEID